MTRLPLLRPYKKVIMKYYKVDIKEVSIEEIEIDRGTTDHIYINGTAIAREQIGYVYLPTFEQAKESLVTYYSEVCESLMHRLALTTGRLNKAKEL